MQNLQNLSFLDEKRLIEKLADIEHARWGHWQKYLHSKYTRNPDGSLVIPAGDVKHWERQINTSYADLTEKEKESDRKEVNNTLKAIKEFIVTNFKGLRIYSADF